MPCVVSIFSVTSWGSFGLVNLGHTQSDWNLFFDDNNNLAEMTSTYIPSFSLFLYSFWKGLSVSFSWVTWYCSGVNFSFNILSSHFGRQLFLMMSSLPEPFLYKR